MRLESARNLFALTYFASVVSVVGSLGDLPERVASSFGGGGAAQAFMTRTMYGALFTSFSAIVPLGLVAAFVWLPRRFSGFVNVPMREAWLAPEFRVELFRRLGLAGYLTGGSAALFFAAMHALLVEANAHVPPRLAQAPFVAVLLAFLACTIGTALGLSLALRKLPVRSSRE